MNLTLRQLRYFDALARHGHFGRAAEESAISQPALSMQIREMEETLGTPLFERGAGQVRLTGFGEEVLTGCATSCGRSTSLATSPAPRATAAGRLRIGVIPTIAPYLLPPSWVALPSGNDGLDIHVRETVTPRLLAGTGRGAARYGHRRAAGVRTRA
jgi:LysR family transcriptional regulator, hydrogen peroxide-inducible genes activator